MVTNIHMDFSSFCVEPGWPVVRFEDSDVRKYVFPIFLYGSNSVKEGCNQDFEKVIA